MKMTELNDVEVAAFRDLLDRQAINDNMLRYCRAVDRFDLELLKSTYWEDGTDDHGQYIGPPHPFAESVVASKGMYESLYHLTGPMLIEMKGHQARAETWFFCVMIFNNTTDNAGRDFLLGGRYKDLYEKRNGQWKVLRRTCIWDWNQDHPHLSNWARSNIPATSNYGAPKPHDPIYEEW
jgi:hypothetical protein